MGHFDLRVPVVMAVIDVYTKLSVSDVIVELVVSEEGPSVLMCRVSLGIHQHSFWRQVLRLPVPALFCGTGGGGAHVCAWGVNWSVLCRDLCQDIQVRCIYCIDVIDGLW